LDLKHGAVIMIAVLIGVIVGWYLLLLVL